MARLRAYRRQADAGLPESQMHRRHRPEDFGRERPFGKSGGRITPSDYVIPVFRLVERFGSLPPSCATPMWDNLPNCPTTLGGEFLKLSTRVLARPKRMKRKRVLFNLLPLFFSRGDYQGRHRAFQRGGER